MEWYFADGNKPVGPLDEQEFQSLVSVGKITPSTLVWRAGMTNWKSYGQFSVAGAPVAGPSPDKPVAGSNTTVCLRCGISYPARDMFPHGDYWVCSQCKPLLLQGVNEAAGVTPVLNYAGFWIRFAAKLVDGIILSIVSMIFGFGARLVSPAYADLDQTLTLLIFLWLVEAVIAATYNTWYIGKYGATPGKMAFDLRVVSPEGGKISYLRALGRHCAAGISGIILLIGYVMAAFDSEKRALHDRICSTRVISR